MSSLFIDQSTEHVLRLQATEDGEVELAVFADAASALLKNEVPQDDPVWVWSRPPNEAWDLCDALVKEIVEASHAARAA